MLTLAELALGRPPEIRDIGLLDAATHRPRASAFGRDAYPHLLEKAAALLHSLVANHPLVDGNKRLGWVATVTFCRLNGVDVAPDEDAAFDLVMAIAAGELSAVGDIARWLGEFVAR